MSGPGCTRKHTPIVSEKQRRFVYAVKNVQADGKGSAKVKKAAASWPSSGPSSPEAHLEEAKHKDLPAKKALHRRFGKKK